MKIHNIPSVQYLSSMLYVLKSQWRFKPTSVKYAEKLRFGQVRTIISVWCWNPGSEGQSQPGFLSSHAENVFQGKWRSCLVGRSETQLYRSMRPRFWHPVDLRADSPISQPRFDTKCVFCGWNQLNKVEFSAEMRQQRLCFRLCPILTNYLTLKVSVRTQPKFCGFRSF